MNGDPTQPPDESSSWQYKPSDPDPQPVLGAETYQAQQSTQAAPQPAQAVVAQTPAIPAPLPQAPVMLASEHHPEISWGALEFIAHEKSPLWYSALIVLTIGLASLVFLVSHDKVSTVLIVVIGIITGVTAGHKPRDLQYMLDSKGITVNRAFRPYGEFKSFAIVQENDVNIIIFMPLKRFALPLSINVGSDEMDAVVAKLSDYLPNDQAHGHDAVDRFVQHVHF